MGKAFDLRLGTASHGLCSKLTESHPRSLRRSGRVISQAAYIGKLSGIHMITSSASPLQSAYTGTLELDVADLFDVEWARRMIVRRR